VASTLTYLPSLEVASSKLVTCIQRSTPSKDHIIWYQSFNSCYKFYPIQFLFFFLFLICLRFVFCFVICVLVHILVCVLLRSCLCSCFHSCSCFFQILCQKLCFKFYWGQFGLLENLGV